MATHFIKGYIQAESGLLERKRGSFIVERIGDEFFDENGGRLRAQRFAVTKDVTDIEIISDRTCGAFIPDAGECERIGMPVIE